MKLFSSIEVDDFDKKYLMSIYPILIATITIFTIIHHAFPSLLSIPARQGPYMLPPEFWTVELILWDLSAIILTCILYPYTIKRHGIWLATLFLTGSIIFTGLEECMWIYGGRFGLTYPTYYFTKAGLWFFDIPVYTCLGWYILAYCCVFIAEKLCNTNKDRIILTSAFGGIFAVSVDFWIDPMNVNLGLIAINRSPIGWFPNWVEFLNPSPGGYWVWLMRDTLKIFSIPLMNFIGWFLVIFLFAVLWEKVRSKFKNNEWDKTKGTKMFYMGIPLCLLACFVLLAFIELFIIRPFFANINIIPVGGG